MEDSNVTPAECGQLLLITLPELMRSVIELLRQRQVGGDEPPSVGQFRVLEVLVHRQMSLKELAVVHHVTPSTMSRTVDLLVRRGWVARHEATRDRRQLVLTLTPDGVAARLEMHRIMEETVSGLLSRLDSDGLREVYTGLQALRSLLPDAAQGTFTTKGMLHFDAEPLKATRCD